MQLLDENRQCSLTHIGLQSSLALTCFVHSLTLFLSKYLRFWNQFLIWSSVISSPLANSVRSSRVRYFWRENNFSRCWSWCWVKWLRCLRFLLGVRSSPTSILNGLGFSSPFPSVLASEGEEEQCKSYLTYLVNKPVQTAGKSLTLSAAEILS